MKVNRGILYGIGAYSLWGLLPIYWKALQSVPATDILANRVVWSLVFVVLLLTFRRNWDWLQPALGNPRIILTYVATTCLLAVNWFTYIWAVNAGFIVETSLGYFINPLFNVLLGMLFLKERLRIGQLLALSLALGGVLYLTFGYGSFPWISIVLAVTFGFYGLIRKTAPLESTEALALETAALFIPAFAYLLYLNVNGTGTFGNSDLATNLLLIGTGVVTGVPLLLFGAAAKRITLTNLGLLQYIAPTLQFLLGVLVYNESFGRDQLIGFGFIWLALLVYTIEGLRHVRKRSKSPPFNESPAAID